MKVDVERAGECYRRLFRPMNYGCVVIARKHVHAALLLVWLLRLNDFDDIRYERNPMGFAVLRISAGYRPPTGLQVDVSPSHVGHFAAALRCEQPDL